MHSLSFAGDPPSEFTNAMATGRFSITVLDEPPRCINFQLTLPDGVDGAGIESLVGDVVVLQPYSGLGPARAGSTEEKSRLGARRLCSSGCEQISWSKAESQQIAVRWLLY